MPRGVHIKRGAVIGAGAIVAHDFAFLRLLLGFPAISSRALTDCLANVSGSFEGKLK
jgi:acetyltransferase-like isoleucine patch superfamily enzyme